MGRTYTRRRRRCRIPVSRSFVFTLPSPPPSFGVWPSADLFLDYSFTDALRNVADLATSNLEIPLLEEDLWYYQYHSLDHVFLVFILRDAAADALILYLTHGVPAAPIVRIQCEISPIPLDLPWVDELSTVTLERLEWHATLRLKTQPGW